MELTHWKKLDNPDYIGAYAFQPNEEKTVTIRTVRREVVVGVEGKREECTVVHFMEPEKPLILNTTNAKMIEKHAGTPYIEQWAGTRIILTVEKVKAFGDIVDAVRVSKKKAKQMDKPKPAPNCADCGKPIEAYGKKTAQEFAEYTKSVFGEAVCFGCGQKRQSAQEQKGGEA